LIVRLILQIKYRERAIGLILVSPICRKPSWSEWIYNKVGVFGIQMQPEVSYSRSLLLWNDVLTSSQLVCLQAIINILYYCGATSFVKDALLQRYFSQEVRASPMGADVLVNYRKVCLPFQTICKDFLRCT
jgi:protein NDRG1